MNEHFDSDTVQRVHLSHFLDNASSPCLESLQDSFVEPGAYWSGAQKDTFFKSLARHSRWKPDLIAEDVGGGKSVADVCSYIELLDQGSTGESRKSCKRDAYPTAHEVSEEWVAVENAAAEALCAEETGWQETALKQRRTQELEKLKNSLRRGTEVVWESPRETGEDHTSGRHSLKRKRLDPNQGDSEEWKDRYKARKRDIRGLWKREDMLSSLNARYLKTMDIMVQMLENSEEVKAVKGGSELDFADTGGYGSARLDGAASSNSPHKVDAASADQRLGHTSNMSGVDSQIGPVLLALDGNVATAQTLSHNHPSDKAFDPATLSYKELQLAIPLPSQGPPSPGQSRLQDSTSGTSLPAQSSVADSVFPTPPPTSPLVAKIPSDASPASRRRLQKRLWARRKRAVQNGLPASEASMEMVKLKRGRKPKSKPVDDQDQAKEDISETRVRVDRQGTPEGLLDPVDGSGDKGGASDGFESDKRKPYGWGKLTARQVSGVTLRKDGMDLFHMEKFTRMMSFLGHVHGLSNEADHIDEVADSSKELSTISYPLLRLLRACVIQFVTCLVSYVVLHKDVETRQKRRIRDIFMTSGVDEIRAENVRECLRHMDRETSTKLFFTKLKRIVRKAIASHAQSEEETGSEPGDRDDSDETGSSDDVSSGGETDHTAPFTGFASVRFNRMTQYAFPPPGDDTHTIAPLFWNPDVLSISGGEGNSLLPDEMDESGLQKDLRAEEKVEEADREAAHRYERELWMEIGIKRMEQDEPVVEVGTKQTGIISQKLEGIGAPGHSNTKVGPSHSLRFRKPGGTVKSRVYINSDEDD